jgi:hypothetical protein
MTDTEKQTEDNILEAHERIRDATAAISQLELSMRSELHSVRDALLNIAGALLAISRKIDDERRERQRMS